MLEPNYRAVTRIITRHFHKLLLFAGRQLPAPITGDGAVFTLASSVSAGTSRGLLPRKNSSSIKTEGYLPDKIKIFLRASSVFNNIKSTPNVL
jgi:hypothetical protein